MQWTPDAVAQIFQAKGRPATNPLIVHVSDTDMARSLSSQWPDIAEKAARCFLAWTIDLSCSKSAIRA